jgi:hypothetical protein
MDSNQTHSCCEQENNVDLWHKLKSAKNRLITQTEFFNKYRPPSDSSIVKTENLDRRSKLTVGESSPKPEGEQPDSMVVALGESSIPYCPSDHNASQQSRLGLDSGESNSQMTGKTYSVNKEAYSVNKEDVGPVTSHGGEIFQDHTVQNTVEVNAGPQGRSLRNANMQDISVVEGPQPHIYCGESIATQSLNFEQTSTVITLEQEATTTLPSPTRTKETASSDVNIITSSELVHSTDTEGTLFSSQY